MKINQNKKKATNLGNVIIYIVIVVIIGLIFVGITRLFSNPKKEKEKEYARIHAISDISQNDKDIKSSLGCKTDSVTSDGIILVKCTDYGNNISIQYGSNEVWYGYLPSDDGLYSYYIDKDKNIVLSMLRKKDANQSNHDQTKNKKFLKKYDMLEYNGKKAYITFFEGGKCSLDFSEYDSYTRNGDFEVKFNDGSCTYCGDNLEITINTTNEYVVSTRYYDSYSKTNKINVIKNDYVMKKAKIRFAEDYKTFEFLDGKFIAQTSPIFFPYYDRDPNMNDDDSSNECNNENANITIDNYVGKNYLEIKGKLEALKINVIVEKKDVNSSDGSKYEEDKIIEQSVKAGKKLSEGDSIILYIPNVIGKYPDFTNGNYTIDDVMNFANNNNIMLTVTKEQSELPSGTIISQSKKAGEEVTTGATLKITVAE